MDESLDEISPESSLTTQGFSGKLRVAWHAITLQEDAYGPVLAARNPGRSGLSVLLIVLLLAALATTLGLVFDWLTEPQYATLEQQIYSTVNQSQFYQNFAAGRPTLAAVMQVVYQLYWLIARMNGVYPNALAIVVSFFNVLVSGLFDWLTYGFIAGLLAGWFGGKPEKKTAVWGTMAVAFSPNLIQVLNLIPGVVVPLVLLRPWVMATSYQALRATYKLSRGRTVIIVLLMPIVNTLFILLALIGGVLIGVLFYSAFIK
jgi:hypothetical protein